MAALEYSSLQTALGSGHTLPTRFEMDVWANWPGAGVCVALGPASSPTAGLQLVAVDLDSDASAVADAVRAVAPPSPVRKRGKKGETAFYLASMAVKSRPFNDGRGQRLLDLLCDGRQTVLPPTIHPETGQPYHWLTLDTLESFDVADLPVLPDDIAERIGDALKPWGCKRGNPLASLNVKALDIARLWALTGCRRNEVAALRWSEVDLARGLLIFDDTKTGRSVRPLGAAAAALLEALRETADPASPYVFPAARGDGFFQGTKDVWPEVVKKAGLPGVTPHTLRHTLGAAAASGGEGLLLVGAILGHSNARSTAIYAHVDRDPAKLAADRATAEIAKALGRPVNGDAPGAPQAANDDVAA